MSYFWICSICDDRHWNDKGIYCDICNDLIGCVNCDNTEVSYCDECLLNKKDEVKAKCLWNVKMLKKNIKESQMTIENEETEIKKKETEIKEMKDRIENLKKNIDDYNKNGYVKLLALLEKE